MNVKADARNALSRYLDKTSLVALSESEVKIVHKRANGKRGKDQKKVKFSWRNIK